MDVAQLETLYNISIPWMEPPKFQIGDRLFIHSLGIEKSLAGVVFKNGQWHYIVLNNGLLYKATGVDLVSAYPRRPVPKPKFAIGEIVSCPFLKIERDLVIGCFCNKNWHYFLQGEVMPIASIYLKNYERISPID